MILSVKKLEQTGDKIMGAYYQAVINKRKRYSTWTTTKDGSKLMEHSYMFNGYVNSVLNMMGDKPFTLDWLCDYHEPVDEWDYDWDSIEEVKSFPIKTSNGISPHYILNNTKHIYINIMELLCLYYKDNEEDVMYIHPLPILCNSESKSMGGGDYHKEDSTRGTWRNDNLQIVWYKEDIPSLYENVTKDCLYKEDEDD